MTDPPVLRGLADRPFVAVFVGSVLLAIHLWTLPRFPAPFVDEAWFANRAWSLLKHGDPVGSLDYGVVNRFPHGSRFFPIAPVIAQAGILSLAPAPSLLALRALSVAMAFFLALAVWAIGRSLFGRSTALIAVILLALSTPFIHSGHLARYDVFAAAFAYGGIALYLLGSRSASLCFVGGFVTGLSTEFHPFAAAVAASLPVLVLYDHRLRAFVDHVPRATLLGVALGLLVFPLAHIVPDPSSYIYLSRVIYGPTHTPHPSDFIAGLRGSVWLAFQAMTFALPVAIWAIIELMRMERKNGHRLVIVTVIVLLAFSVLVRNKLSYYAILFTPVLELCIAAAITRTLFGLNFSPTSVVVTLAIAIGFVGASIRASVSVLNEDSWLQFTHVEDKLGTVIRPGETIMGSQVYWFALYNHTYYSWEQVVYLRRLHPELSIAAALDTMAPDIFLRDGHLDEYISDAAGPSLYSQALRLPKQEVEDWLENRSTVVADFDGGLYGRIRVYRMNRLSTQREAVDGSGQH